MFPYTCTLYMKKNDIEYKFTIKIVYQNGLDKFNTVSYLAGNRLSVYKMESYSKTCLDLLSLILRERLYKIYIPPFKV